MQPLQAKSLPLKKLQGWFQEEIVLPHETPRRKSARQKTNASRALLPSKTLQAQERMEIYTKMYFLRLHDCLMEDFPALEQVLGHERFDALIRQYLTKFPSRHYSLNVLGRRMPEFLSKNASISRRALLRDVARLECAMAEVFDEAQSPILDPKTLAKLSPQQWEKARFQTIAALRLLVLEYSVNILVTAARNQKPLPEISKRRNWVVVYRKDYRVWRMELSEPMFVLLSALQKGKTLREALILCKKTWKGTPEELEKDIFSWFGEWSAEGFFSAISK